MDYLTPLAQEKRQPFEGLANKSRSDTLFVTDKDGEIFEFPLEKSCITIGRARENDLVLTDYAISRHHLRIERDDSVWVATDVNSTNGVVLNSQLLDTKIGSNWEPDSPLQIGPYSLKWSRAETAVPDQMLTYIERPAGIPDEPPELNIEVEQRSVYDDQHITISVALHNRRASADTYEVQLEGLPENWVDSVEQRVRVEKMGATGVSFIVRPSIFDTMSSGQYPFSVSIRSLSNPALSASASDTISVVSSHQFMSEMVEAKKSFGGVTVLSVQNIGNSADIYEVTPHSTDPNLTFDTRHWSMALTQRTMDKMYITITSAKRPLIGKPDIAPFSLTVQSQSGHTREHQGHVEIQPRITSTMIFLCLLLLVLVSAVVWGTFQINSGASVWLPILEQFAALDFTSFTNI